MFKQTIKFVQNEKRDFEEITIKNDGYSFSEYGYGYNSISGYLIDYPFEHDENFFLGTPYNFRRQKGRCMMAKCEDSTCYGVSVQEDSEGNTCFRPIVCLKKDILLKTNDNGQTYYL